MAPYARAARWFPLGIDPFADLRLVLFDGMEAEFTAKAREAGGENEMYASSIIYLNIYINQITGTGNHSDQKSLLDASTIWSCTRILRRWSPDSAISCRDLRKILT